MRGKYYITGFLLVFVLSVNAQMDTSLMLISKIDFQPGYQLHDNNEILLMGYSLSIGGYVDLPSPTLNFKEGDSVKLDMWNLSQGPPHTIHLHGLDVDQANDGVPALSYAVPHDDTGSYVFKAPHPGTYLYHCHETSVLHVQAGMYGVLVVRPQSADTLTWENGYSFHSERTWLASEIDTNWHHDTIIHHDYDPQATTHVVLDYKPQHFLINGLSEQQLDNAVEINASVGEIVYMRLANVGYYGTRFIFPPGLNAQAVASDGRPLPVTFVSDTIEVLPGERFGVLIEANSEFQDVVNVEYFNLNTGEVENTQQPAVNINGFLGIEENNGQELVVYPNPARDVIAVKGAKNATVTIRNMFGQTVRQIENVNGTIDVRGMSNGVYILTITSGNSSRTFKLLIQK